MNVTSLARATAGWAPSDLGRRNRALVLECLRKGTALSRADLARLTGLSKAAMTNITTELLSENILREIPEESLTTSEFTKRQRSRLTINSNYAVAIGLEVTTDLHLRGLVIDAIGTSVASAELTFANSDNLESLLGPIIDLVGALQSQVKPHQSQIRGIGLTLPGLVDARQGTSLWWPGHQRWEGVSLQAILSERLGLPVTVDWRVYAAALAELEYGYGRGAHSFLYIHIGSGIGMGIAFGNEIMRGSRSMAGQLGHIKVTDSPVTCACGSQGCLQAVATVPAIVHRCERALQDGVRSLLTRPMADLEGSLTFSEIVEGAQRGDKLVLNIMEEACEYIGIALADVINILNPELIVLGGEITRAGEIFLDLVRRAMRRHSFPQIQDAVHLELSRLPQPGIAALGGGTIILNRLFRFGSVSEDGLVRQAINESPL